MLFSILVVINEQAKCLEEKTREQSKSKLWQDIGLEELQLQSLSKLQYVTL